MLELVYFLTLGDLNRFPSRSETKYAIQINSAWTTAIKNDIRVPISEYEEASIEAKWLNDVWNALDDLYIAIDYRTKADVMEKAERLRRLVGCRAYQTGVLPYPVPLHRVRQPE